jgi:hypothetical protein
MFNSSVCYARYRVNVAPKLAASSSKLNAAAHFVNSNSAQINSGRQYDLSCLGWLLSGQRGIADALRVYDNISERQAANCC